MNNDRVIEMIFNELRHAEEKHSGWPDDEIHAVGIMVEEAGEAMQAALDHHYRNVPLDKLIKELAQTGAMVIRAMLNLKETDINAGD